MSGPVSGFADLSGHDLGERVVSFDDRDAILYAIAVGAQPDQLDLVFERDLRVLPTFGCALGLWAVEKAGELGVYDRTNSLHVGQTLDVRGPLEPGPVEMAGRITDVWDKGRATVVGIEVTADVFTAGYTIFLPGVGDWGGDRGPATPKSDPIEPTWTTAVPTRREAAVLYRLTGDRHPVHVDPEVSAAMGLGPPILHGLATVGIAARALAAAVDAHPADLVALDARLASPVRPGQGLRVAAAVGPDRRVEFEAVIAGATAVTGQARFA